MNIKSCLPKTYAEKVFPRFNLREYQVSTEEIRLNEYNWWYLSVSLLYIFSALAIWEPGYYIVIGIHAVYLAETLIKGKKVLSFQVQVRFAWLLLALTGFWPAGRFFMFLILFILTYIVVFTGKCLISSLLVKLPWNRQEKVA